MKANIEKLLIVVLLLMAMKTLATWDTNNRIEVHGKLDDKGYAVLLSPIKMEQHDVLLVAFDEQGRKFIIIKNPNESDLKNYHGTIVSNLQEKEIQSVKYHG